MNYLYLLDCPFELSSQSEDRSVLFLSTVEKRKSLSRFEAHPTPPLVRIISAQWPLLALSIYSLLGWIGGGMGQSSIPFTWKRLTLVFQNRQLSWGLRRGLGAIRPHSPLSLLKSVGDTNPSGKRYGFLWKVSWG